MSAPPVSVLGRISLLLDQFAQTPRQSVSDLARRSGLPKTTTFRLTRELVEHGFLEHHGADLALGLRFFELGSQAARPLNLRRLTYARMEDLRRRTGHTVHLAVLDGSHVVYIEIIHSRTSPRMPSRVGGRLPAHATGVGKALLAFSRPLLAQTAIARGLTPLGPRTIVDPDVLLASLDETRRVGYATEREESGPGITCVAGALVLTPGSDPVAALSVSGWIGDFDTTAVAVALTDTLRALRAEAARLPAALRQWST